jgi:hypothetical protein
MQRDPLKIYLGDHHAGSTSGLKLARRTLRRDHDPATRDALMRIATEIAEDRVALEQVMQGVGARPSRIKDQLAWTLAKLGRLKPNGRIRGESALGRLVELEALYLGIAGKRALWESLRHVPAVSTNPAVNLAELVHRADDQLERLEGFRRDAAVDALQSDRAGADQSAA